MRTTSATTFTRLVGVTRGVAHPDQVADFYRWLLGVDPAAVGLAFAAGGPPVSMVWASRGGAGRTEDPDGVAAETVAAGDDGASTGVVLDHVRLNCADLEATARHYLARGLRLTWSGAPGGVTFVDGDHDDWRTGAEWVHVSGERGYLSLSQADWKEYGEHIAASGPPRFIHIGFAVTDLDSILRRVHDRGVATIHNDSPVGRHVYLNDPDGDAMLGTNIELVEYSAGVRRSG